DRGADPDRGRARASDAAGPQGRHLRRARRRPGERALLRRGRARLRVVLPVPRAGGAAGGGAGRDPGGAGREGREGREEEGARAVAREGAAGARARRAVGLGAEAAMSARAALLAGALGLALAAGCARPGWLRAPDLPDLDMPSVDLPSFRSREPAV